MIFQIDKGIDIRDINVQRHPVKSELQATLKAMVVGDSILVDEAVIPKNKLMAWLHDIELLEMRLQGRDGRFWRYRTRTVEGGTRVFKTNL